jgi:DNA repair protein RadC
MTYPDLSKKSSEEYLIADGGKPNNDEIREAIELLRELQEEDGKVTIPEVDLTIERTMEFSKYPKIKNPSEAAKIFKDFWNESTIQVQESFYVMLLDTSNQVIAVYFQAKGGISATLADVELTVAAASKALARGVIIAHNHPSGSLVFSQADINLTQKLGRALKTVDIVLLDSMVITNAGHVSMSNSGQMPSFEKGGSLTDFQKEKIHKTMSEFKRHELHSGSKTGPLVTDRDQAIAIALSQANASKYDEGGTLVKSLNVLDYKNPYEVNRAIETLLNSKGENRENYSIEELNFISFYSGYGGLEKQGDFSVSELKGLLYEYFTPDAVVQKMWGLAYKYGYGTIGDNSVFEPSTGVGAFLKYAPSGVDVAGNEINKYSAQICQLLYPNVHIVLKGFETNFIANNNSIRDKTKDLKKFSLVIGNPPYGKLESKYISMGEDKFTMAGNWIEYFIVRGLDLLVKDGLLIYIVGAEQRNGGTLFLDSKMSKVKEMIFAKAELIDGYRLPVNIFERTGVSSEILVFKKR